MAVRINPCFGCPLRHGCELKGEFSKRVRGLGLRSATFDCPALSAKLAKGSRVVVTMPEMGTTEYGDTYVQCGRREVNATIHNVSGFMFACVVDKADVQAMVDDGVVAESADPDRIRFRKRMRHSRVVRFIDEPKRQICEFGNVVGRDGCDQRPENEVACHCKEAISHKMETI